MGRAMAVKTTDVKSAKATAAKDDAASPAEPMEAPKGGCVVDDGTTHNGGPVHGGKVCSAHENRYYQDGKPRP